MRWSCRLLFLATCLLIPIESRSQTTSSDRFTLGLRLSDGSYRTCIFSYENGKFTVTTRNGMLVAPTSIGPRQIWVERKKVTNWAEDFLMVTKPGQQVKAPSIDTETAELIKGFSRTKITFVGPSYIGVEDISDGAAKDGTSPFAYRELRVYSMAKPLDALAIGNVISGANAVFLKAAAAAYKKAPAKLRPKLAPKPDLTNWSLKFTSNGWQVFGRLGYLKEKDRGTFYEFPAPIKVPPQLAASLSTNKTLVSPDAGWTIVFEAGQLRLKTNAKTTTTTAPYLYKLNGAEIVMTIWSKRS